MSLARTVQSDGSSIVNLSQSFATGSHNVTRPYTSYYLDVSAGPITMIGDPAPIANDEYLFKVVAGDAGVNNVSFDGNGKTLENVTGISPLVTVGLGWNRIKYNGTGWSIV